MNEVVFAAIERESALTAGPRPDPVLLERFRERLPAGFAGPVLRPELLPEDLAPALRNYKNNGPPVVPMGKLPEPLRSEFAWAIFRVLDLGGTLSIALLNRVVFHLTAVLTRSQWRVVRSFLQRSGADWERAIAATVAERRGELAPRTRDEVRNTFRRIYTILWFDYDQRPWWHRDVWVPRLDGRIPQRRHEPTRLSVRWLDLNPGWLREAVKYYARVSLESEALTWSTVAAFPNHFRLFSQFLSDRPQITEPALAAEPGEVRRVALDYRGWLLQQRCRHGPTKGQPLGTAARSHALGRLESFYAFMERDKHAAAGELGDLRWLALDAPHSRLYRAGDKPRKRTEADGANLIPDAALKALMAGIELLGKPLSEGGRGDPQAMRILALLAKLGRRQSEVRMLDFAPLEPLASQAVQGDADGFVARLRYQQTKIDGAPQVILVDQETVDIITAQQAWVRERMAAKGLAGVEPKYLFLALNGNRRGDGSYRWPVLYARIRWLVERLDIRDDHGRLVQFSKTHRFRHTKATELINLGVPLHVVQRYFGHLSPKMTMHYAQTLEETHRREFLRYRKITADGGELDVSPEDLYDLLALDQRTDRVLPNGLCMLPPRDTCNRGNACLTCTKFVTDASFLEEHRAQHGRLLELVTVRDAAHLQRTGRPMSDENVWKRERLRERQALERIIGKLERDDLTGQAIRAPGVPR